MSHSAQIDRIIEVYRDMRFMQEQRKRLDLAFQAFVRTLCGYSTHLPAKERGPLLKRAQAIVDGRAPDDPLVSRVEIMREGSDAAAAAVSKIERQKQRELESIVKGLPIWTEWAADIRGLGAKSIGIIIGEAGDLGAYPKNPEKRIGRSAREIRRYGEAEIRKRMGVAVIDGIAQGKLGKGATAEDWIVHGYNAKRRSALYTIGAAIVKQADSPYRAIYLERKRIEKERFEARGYTVKPSAEIKKAEAGACISLGHIDRRAQRWMEQRVLRHMYRAWLRTMVEDRPEARDIHAEEERPTA